MKKICICTTVSLTLKSFVVPTAIYLHENCGYDITLICNNDEEFAKTLPEYIHYIPVKMARGVDFSGFKSVIDFIKIFNKQKFDLVQYSTPNASFYASIAAKLCRVPIRLYCQWGIRYIGFSGTGRKIFKFIEKIICKLSTHVRSQSKKNMQFAIDEKLCKLDKISVIGIGGTIGVDLKECDSIDKEKTRKELRGKYSIPENAFVFGFVGRINRDKGINEYISAFEKIRDKYSDIYIALVGGIDDKNPIDCDLMKTAQNDERIVFTGSVPSNEVYSHMAMMDVLVHPTYREGFGKVIQEGMGMYLPIITTDIPGPSEVIENNISGILAEVKNSDDLAKKMEFIYTDNEKRESFAKEGRLRAEKYFDRPIMLNNIAEEMENLLKG